MALGLKDKLSPPLYDLMNKAAEKKFAPQRERILEHARGRVLEIGVGTGFNLRHYPASVDELVITDPTEGMLERATRRADEAGRPVTAVRASVESLPFEDASFDTVVSTLVLCSVRDQDDALAEVSRVLRPGGRLLFIEHVRSEHPGRAKWQDRLAPVWKVMADGCHPNRDTLARIEANGFSVGDLERGSLPQSPPIVRPYVAGTATVSSRATRFSPVNASPAWNDEETTT